MAVTFVGIFFFVVVNFGVLVFGNSDREFVDCFWIFFVRNATSETETTDRRKPFHFQLLVCFCVCASCISK